MSDALPFYDPEEYEYDVLTPASLEETTDVLAQYTDITAFGVGQAKTVDHFWRELEAREAELRLTSDGRLLRFARGATMVLYHQGRFGRWYWLAEAEQVFKDGRVRVRDLDVSIGEKCIGDEPPHVAAQRALNEELGLPTERIDIGEATVVRSVLPSDSYPGTWRDYLTDNYQVLMPDDLYQEEYFERQADKTTVWRWQLLPFGMQSRLKQLGIV